MIKELPKFAEEIIVYPVFLQHFSVSSLVFILFSFFISCQVSI